MKKSFFNFFAFLLIITVATNGFAQKLITKTGTVKFQASMPSYEEVAAENKSVSAVLEQSTGDFAALVLIKVSDLKWRLWKNTLTKIIWNLKNFQKQL